MIEITSQLNSYEEKKYLRIITCGKFSSHDCLYLPAMLQAQTNDFKSQFSNPDQSDCNIVEKTWVDYPSMLGSLTGADNERFRVDHAFSFKSPKLIKTQLVDASSLDLCVRKYLEQLPVVEVGVIAITEPLNEGSAIYRYAYLLHLLNVKHIVLAFDRQAFDAISEAEFTQISDVFSDYMKQISVDGTSLINVDAVLVTGSNGEEANWYNGQTLLHYLEAVSLKNEPSQIALRMLVNGPQKNAVTESQYSGQIVSGTLKVGDEIKVLPSAKLTRIGSMYEIVNSGGQVTFSLEDDINLSMGDVVVDAKDPCEVSDQFATKIVWASKDDMLPGRSYIFKCGMHECLATITDPKHKVNVETLAQEPAAIFSLDEIGECNICLDKQLVFDPFVKDKNFGGFVLIDRFSKEEVGVGFIKFALRRSENIHWQAMDISKATRARMKGQNPAVLWFTGLSGSGKSTIANLLEQKLTAIGRHTYALDGDNVRHGLNKDLGFTDADRVENIRRVTQVAKLMADAGLIVLTSFISPFRAERQMARAEIEEGEFLEIYVETPLEVAEARDVKGLYKKARAGKIKNFTGIDSPYEPPLNSEIRVNTAEMSAEDCADMILSELKKRDII